MLSRRAFAAVVVVSTASMPAVTRRSFASSAEEAAEWKPAPWGAELDAEVARAKKGFTGIVTVYAADPLRKVHHGLHADQPSYLASCVKIAFMVEVFRQIEKGELSLDEEVTYTEEDIRDGAPNVNPKPVGSKFKIRELLEFMIKESDNAASDMLVKRVGLDRINQGLKEQGFEGWTPLTRLVDVRVGVFRELDVRADDFTGMDVRTIRWTPIWDPQIAKLTSMFGRRAGTYTKQQLLDAYDRFYATGVNSARLDTIGRMFLAMLRGELVSPEASKQMLALMTDIHTSQKRILGRLPKGTKVAHKTGSQFLRICDLGIIYLPDDQPLIFCACLAEEGSDRNGAEDVLAKVARKAYDLVLAEHQRAKRE